MLSPKVEKTLLQTAIAVGCLIPICAGFAGIIDGTYFVGGGTDGNVNVDSHFRYMSGILLAIGFGYALSIRHIEQHSDVFRLLTFFVLVGGLSRALGFLLDAVPEHGMQYAIIMELIVAPVIWLWQVRVAHRFGNPAKPGHC
jgi:hypothetical protein